MEGVEQINFENVDNNISSKDVHCIVDTFVVKKTEKLVCLPM